MAKSPFTTGSTIKVDSIVIDASSPLDGEILIYDGTQFITEPPVPVGTIELWGGFSSNIPYGWLLCNGQQVLSSSALGVVLSTRYNTGGETAGYVRVPDMASQLPIGIASGGAGGTTTLTFNSSAGTHAHSGFNTTVATTNSDGGLHWHNYSAGGAHSHFTSGSYFSHTHNSGTPSNTHLHYTNGANIAYINTGNTAHSASDHGNTANDGASHTHNSGTESVTHYHNISTGNSSSGSHPHTWNSNSTTSNATVASGASDHNQTIFVIAVCFIIKY